MKNFKTKTLVAALAGFSTIGAVGVAEAVSSMVTAWVKS